MILGSRATLVTLPKFGFVCLNVPSGCVVKVGDKFGNPGLRWLNALTKSVLNRSLRFSRQRKFLTNEMSQLCTPGPITIPRPDVPKVVVAGANAAVLNHCAIVSGPSGSAIRFGLVLPPFCNKSPL